MSIIHSKWKKLVALAALTVGTSAAHAADKPNILVIWGDDIGVHNVSAYNHGIMGYQTPNIDRIANEGAMFTDAYAQQSCTAGRASFILGQHPFRTGLLTIGMPGSDHGIPDWTPTIGDILKEQGYTTGQFGKNHLGDKDKHLPTNHGFDEFFGNLYHLNAEEEPESYYYPKDPEFRKKFGPRGVIHSTADGKIEDTGPLTKKRMETVDSEFLTAALDFMERAVDQDKPFFVWMNTTRMHVWTHLKPESDGVTGVGLYADGMVEHDKSVGVLLDKLDELKIADNTIVVYSTDNGAETVTWPDGGTTPFHGEKGTTWEGGHRVPMLVRWPGVVKPNTKYNDIISQEDWMPTFAAAAGEPDLVNKLKKGYRANGTKWRIHPDGYNFLPYFKGEAEAPRDEIFYFGATGELNAVRYQDWKIHFATLEGDITTATRFTPAWPLVINLRADPYQKGALESEMYLKWYAENTMWTFVPIQAEAMKFLKTIPEYPFQSGSSLNLSNISYKTFEMKDAMERLQKLETTTPRN
ncbi:arylsulfatase [Gilvimarinus japonicus]|uniref:Arylsulfatase n=1 Tax=Gilvimarinus japonicus TaxID=1796469 RepID=A0ABV7HWX9_9GAMM